MNLSGMKVITSLVVSALLAGCASPMPSVGYKNDMSNVVLPSGDYVVDVTGNMSTKMFLTHRNKLPSGMASDESFFDLFRLDSGMVLDVSGKSYVAATFISEVKDHKRENLSGIWMGGTEDKLMVVVKHNGCEAYLHDVRLLNEPDVQACGLTLNFTAR